MDRNWIQVTPSEFAWERDALAFLKRNLPDHEPYRAWANFEFVLDGSIGEVDTLVVSPKGVFLIEIKSWPGELRGDAGTWRRTPPGHTRERSDDNPLLLTNRKAKRLKSLLGRQAAFRGQQLPYISALVFLSHPELDCRLDPGGREGITGLGKDDDGNPIQKGGLPGGHRRDLAHHAGGARRARPPSHRQADGEAHRAWRSSRPASGRRSGRERSATSNSRNCSTRAPATRTSPPSTRARQHTHRRVRIYGTPDADPMQRELITRAAQREFELLAPVQHPGIVHALDLHEHELGPALVFERDPTEIRLDQYLDQRGASLNLFDRLALVRDLAETVASAHGRRLAHRALSPRSVLVVRPGTAEQRFCIINWQTGSREGGGSTRGHGRGHTPRRPADRHRQRPPYLAPEALTVADADPQLLDVFSLGAIAYLVFTGQPPATTLAGSHRAPAARRRPRGLSDPRRRRRVPRGPRPRSDRRRRDPPHVIGRGLHRRDLARGRGDHRTREQPDEPEEVKPLAAKPGDDVAGFTVVKRLGRGSTAVALLVRDADDQQRVLKIAADPDRNDRVRDEGEVLSEASRSHDHRRPRQADRRRRPHWTRAVVRRRGDACPPPPQSGTAQPRGPRALGRRSAFGRQLPRARGDPASRHQAREPRDHRGRGTQGSAISS